MNLSFGTYERAVLTINNEFPAPTVIVEQGDIINITIINESFEATTIHWHGLLQRNTLDMDGVPGVTQCSIPPNQSYVYTFSTHNQSGTYWYHSHYSMQYGDGLKGILIIKDQYDPWKMFYHAEEIIQLTDWYQTPVHILLKPYLYPGQLEPVPDTALINGIGQLNCASDKNCSYYVASIIRGTTKRFRIINTSVYARITLTIDEHDMRLIEADGIYLDGNKYVKTLRLNPGQRYSVLVTAKQYSTRNYWIRATIHPFIELNYRYNYSIEPNVKAILQYNNQEINISSIDTDINHTFLINQSMIDGEIFSDELELVPMNYTEYHVPKSNSIKTFIFDSKHKGSKPGYMYFNNETFIHPTNQTILSSILFSNSDEITWPATVKICHDEIVDIVINNIDYAPHPFHLHGHHVWVLSQGNTSHGYVNKTTFKYLSYNEINPIYRDTFTVNPRSYIVFRFKADNPGIWMMHCHNDWHLQVGMALVFIESHQTIRNYYFQQNLTNYIPYQCLFH